MSNEFDTILNNAIKQCNGDMEVKKFPYIYPFTTENINGYIDYFDLNNKSLLTVGSSGDQVISAIDKGAKDITVLDINEYTKYYYYLKIASILSLKYDEFMNFLRYIDYPLFFTRNEMVFNINTFERIKSTLKKIDVESFEFWNTLFSIHRGILVRESLFSSDELDNHMLKRIDKYFESKESFNSIKEKVADIRPKFIVGDILNPSLDKKYDNIWLSNIGCYLTLDKLKKIVDNLDKNLNIDGSMLISYLYSINVLGVTTKSRNPIYDVDKVIELLDEYLPSLFSVEGVSMNDKDAILTYKKKR